MDGAEDGVDGTALGRGRPVLVSHRTRVSPIVTRSSFRLVIRLYEVNYVDFVFGDLWVVFLCEGLVIDADEIGSELYPGQRVGY